MSGFVYKDQIYALGAVLYEMLTGERPDKDLVAPSKRVEIDVRLDEMAEKMGAQLASQLMSQMHDVRFDITSDKITYISANGERKSQSYETARLTDAVGKSLAVCFDSRIDTPTGVSSAQSRRLTRRGMTL